MVFQIKNLKQEGVLVIMGQFTTLLQSEMYTNQPKHYVRYKFYFYRIINLLIFF